MYCKSCECYRVASVPSWATNTIKTSATKKKHKRSTGVGQNGLAGAASWLATRRCKERKEKKTAGKLMYSRASLAISRKRCHTMMKLLEGNAMEWSVHKNIRRIKEIALAQPTNGVGTVTSISFYLIHHMSSLFLSQKMSTDFKIPSFLQVFLDILVKIPPRLTHDGTRRNKTSLMFSFFALIPI